MTEHKHQYGLYINITRTHVIEGPLGWRLGISPSSVSLSATRALAASENPLNLKY